MTPDDFNGLFQLGMWGEWQKRVEEALPNFAADKIYVDQKSIPQEEFERVALELNNSRFNGISSVGATKDVEFGAHLVETKAFGPVTRMWLDSQVEIDFLKRNLPELQDYEVIDVGAGYGRLAVPLAQHVRKVICIDPVEISRRMCREYTKGVGIDDPGVERVWCPDLKSFIERALEVAPHRATKSLAINVHSWSECTLPQIALWLTFLKEIRIDRLFTVVHGSSTTGDAYKLWGGEPGEFRSLLEERCELIVEEEIGLSRHPHALWRLK